MDNSDHGMGCGNVRLQFVPGPVLLFIGFVLQIVALSSANWCRAADDSVYMGLWQICFQVKVAEVQCFEFRERDYTPSKYKHRSAITVQIQVIIQKAISGCIYIVMRQIPYLDYRNQSLDEQLDTD